MTAGSYASASVIVQQGMVAGPGVGVPVLTFTAREPGPTVALGANLHGDECTGIGVIHAMISDLPTTLRRGGVVVYPSLNPKGLEEGTRRLPGDVLDPNRAFPGTLRGSGAQRHAARIWQDLTARRPDLYIDLHTDAGGAVPYSIVDRVIDEENRSPSLSDLLRRTRRVGPAPLGLRTIDLAEATGFTVLREYPVARYQRFELDRSLTGALINTAHIAAFTLEVGPRRWLDPAAVDLAVRAVRGVLGALGLVDASVSPHPSRRTDRIWRRETGPRTTRAGILVPLVQPGGDFRRGESIGELRGLMGERRELLRAPSDGWIVALPEVTHAAVGQACATIAVAEDEPDAN